LPPVAAAEIPSDAVCELRASALTETAAPRPMTPNTFEEKSLEGSFFDFPFL
jgi:hypothetical protein